MNQYKDESGYSQIAKSCHFLLSLHCRMPRELGLPAAVAVRVLPKRRIKYENEMKMKITHQAT